jgi:hypothetical protein
MPIEFIGMIGVKPEGATGAAVHVIGGEIDLAWIRDFSRAHERADFDKVLVGYMSTSAEGFVVAGYAAAHTERLGYLIAHRPGRRRSRRARPPRSITSAAAGSRSTSSPAAATSSRRGTATGSTTTRATAAPTST